MKNLLKLFGIIALVAVIGFSMSACKDTPDPQGKLTITNFSGEFTADYYVMGRVYDGAFSQASANKVLIFATETPTGNTIKGAKVTGTTITLNVYNADGTLFTGNKIVAGVKLELLVCQNETLNLSVPNGWVGDKFYYNTPTIAFTNGNASIDVGAQMYED